MTNYCPSCGAKIVDTNAKFCSICGANLNGGNAQTSNASYNNNINAGNILGTLVTVSLLGGLTRQLYYMGGRYFLDPYCRRPYVGPRILGLFGPGPHGGMGPHGGHGPMGGPGGPHGGMGGPGGHR